MKLEKLTMPAAALAVLGVLFAFAARPQIQMEPTASEWRMLSARNTSLVTDATTGSQSYEEVPAVYMYNTRTGITYEFFNDCENLRHGCFVQVAYTLDYKGLDGYYIRPDPTSADPDALPQ